MDSASPGVVCQGDSFCYRRAEVLARFDNLRPSAGAGQHFTGVWSPFATLILNHPRARSRQTTRMPPVVLNVQHCRLRGPRCRRHYLGIQQNISIIVELLTNLVRLCK